MTITQPACAAARTLGQYHGSRFDITTGAVINGPANQPLHMYEVSEVDGNIQVRG